MNRPYSASDYSRVKREIISDPRKRAETEKEFKELCAHAPRKYADVENCEASSGDHLSNCRKAVNCFDVSASEDCMYCALGVKVRDCVDCSGITGSELCYQSAACPENYRIVASSTIWPKSSYLAYCIFCRSSSNCFGCVSLIRSEHCILNQQYTKAEYQCLLQKVIAHIEKTGEWGEFLSPSLSPFAYNETAAQDLYPLERETALGLGFSWSDYKPDAPRVSKILLPEELTAIDLAAPGTEEMFKTSGIKCAATGNIFGVIKQEFDFYREQGLALPSISPDERHKRRLARRNGRSIRSAACARCGQTCQTSWPESEANIWCEGCYQGLAVERA